MVGVLSCVSILFRLVVKLLVVLIIVLLRLISVVLMCGVVKWIGVVFVVVLVGVWLVNDELVMVLVLFDGCECCVYFVDYFVVVGFVEDC